MIMSFTDRSLLLAGKTVLVRIPGDGRLEEDQITKLRAMLQSRARLALIAGAGNPAGDINPAMSLRSLAPTLGEVIGVPVAFIAESIGAGAEAGLAAIPFGSVGLLENLRFHPDERRKSHSFALRLSVLGDFYLDLGEPPRTTGAWQDRLAAMLPQPPFLTATPTSKEDA